VLLNPTRLWSPKISGQALDQVVAYAMAHAAWIAKYGLPTPAEVAVLRACYGVSVATLAQRISTGRLIAAEEWAIIACHIHPPLPDGLSETAYWRVVRVGTIVTQPVVWVIVDRDGNRVAKAGPFDSCIAAMNTLEELQAV
jgi:hypothetical protein